MTRALIAEDEPLLARALTAELGRAWPELQVVATVGDGASAVRQALEHRPEVLFFDIRMPGLGGLEAAAELADAWPAGSPFPALVFVTAYDQYAVQAFEAQAVDYVLKPVQPARLARTVATLKERLAGQKPGRPEEGLEAAVAQLRHLLEAGTPAPEAPESASLPPGSAPLKVIQAGVGNSIRMVPVGEIVYLEAADKYLRVLTAEHEYLLRTPLKDLLPQLDPAVFWQIHRATVVRADAVESVVRDESGKLSLTLRGRDEKLTVSRLYAHLFRAM